MRDKRTMLRSAEPAVPESKKAELTKGLSFGSSAIFSKDPPLSAPFSRRVWLFRVSLSHDCISVNTIVKYKKMIVHGQSCEGEELSLSA